MKPTLRPFISLAVILTLFSCKKTKENSPIKIANNAHETVDRTPFSLEQLDQYSSIRAIKVPKSLSFAGESVPMHDPDVYERLERELYVNTFWHSSTILLLKRSSRWLPKISKILKEESIPEDFKYLAVIESGLMNVVSPSEAVGFWQILKPTGKELGLEINKEIDERYDPIKSTYAAAKYLKKSFEIFGSWTNAAAAYNRGNRGITEVLDEQHVKSYYDLKLNEETGRYIFRILAAKEILTNPERYGFNLSEEEKYKAEPTYELTVNESIKDLSAFAVNQGINYKLLVRHNPWLRKNKLTIKKKSKYVLKFPKDSAIKSSIASKS